MTEKYVTKDFCRMQVDSLRKELEHSKTEIVGDLTIKAEKQSREYEKYVKQEIDRAIKEIKEQDTSAKQRAGLSLSAKAAIGAALITSIGSVVSTMILVFVK